MNLFLEHGKNLTVKQIRHAPHQGLPTELEQRLMCRCEGRERDLYELNLKLDKCMLECTILAMVMNVLSQLASFQISRLLVNDFFHTAPTSESAISVSRQSKRIFSSQRENN